MNHSDDTIVAIVTPLGEGGLGVVRLSGSQAFSIGDRLFQSKKKISEAPSHTLHHGWIAGVDEVIASVFRSPHSYTGEDVLEFSCHGSPVILKEVVKLCESSGARMAQPGEFTERAFLNGKMDLAQAEAVAQLIHSVSTKARAVATEQLKGQLSHRIKKIRSPLIDLLAHVEANLDFSEEGLPLIDQHKMKSSLTSVLQDLGDLLSTSVKGRWFREGLRVALAGKPNVGKSSLFNALLAQDRAIVTSVPGTTRDTLEEKMEWEGFPIVLVDTAGLRSTTDEVESLGTARAEQAHAHADILLLVLDASQPLTREDQDLLARLKDRNTVVVLNKADCGLQVQWPEGVVVSAKNGQGLSQLKLAVLHKVQGSSKESESTLVITNLRHAKHLEKAKGHLLQAMKAVDQKESEEAMALDIRAALQELGQITGEEITEDVLSAIFRQFCIGK
ncbi:MAG: tRNA modification GTPase MnmE [Elusimicrobia bacterium]|nr:tRNA modification GTPase MnmE [Elusimicrobiota bacterium]